MKKHTFKMLTAAFLAGTMLLASTGCSNKPVSSAPSSAAATGGESAAAPASSGGKVTIRIGGGPSSSANYTTFAGIGNLIMKDNPDYLVNTEISTGSQENIRMIQNGTAQFGVAMTDVEEAAAKENREFEGSPVDICHVMGGYTTMLHMFVPKDSDINSIADLKGKKLAVSKGAMAQYYMPILLEAYGLTTDDVQITETALQDICDAVNDGNADFGVHITPYTSSPIADLAATKGIKLISLDQEHIDKIVAENPFFFETTIPGGTYTGIDNDTVVIYDTIRAALPPGFGPNEGEPFLSPEDPMDPEALPTVRGIRVLDAPLDALTAEDFERTLEAMALRRNNIEGEIEFLEEIEADEADINELTADLTTIDQDIADVIARKEAFEDLLKRQMEE